MCGIVGLKPTVGRVPSEGIVPAVRRIDCPTVFARTVHDALVVHEHVAGLHEGDPYSFEQPQIRRAIRRVGVLADGLLEEICSRVVIDAYRIAVARLVSAGYTVHPFDAEPFLAAGSLLYGGAFVAERTSAVGEFLAANPTDADPTVKSIIMAGFELSAVDAFRGEYALAEHRHVVDRVWRDVDAVLFPTVPYTASLEELAREPIAANGRMGTFTTCTNLLDLCAIALPVEPGVPGASVQLMAPAWTDDAVGDVAIIIEDANSDSPDAGIARGISGTRPGERSIVVVGAHLEGMPLHQQLADRGARLLGATTTAESYRLYALAESSPPKPGLQRVAADGAQIHVEVYALGDAEFGSFVGLIPPPLGIGSVELADGSWHKGFICEPIGLDAALDITHFGGWRAYVASSKASR
jgi:allophanate hydrolase